MIKVKRFFYKTLITASAIIAVVFAGGCTHPLSKNTGEILPEAGQGRITVTVHGIYGETDSGVRTLLPSGGFTKYILGFSSDTAGVSVPDPVQLNGGANSRTIELTPGVWTVTATAYAGETASGSGSKTITVIADNTISVPITIDTILPGSGDTGTFAYGVSFPKDKTTAASLTLSPLDGYSGTDTQIDLLSVYNAGQSKSSGTQALTPGYYLMTIVLENTAARLTAGVTEVVHIYAGLTTDGTAYSFTENDFSALVPLAGTISVKPGSGDTLPPGLSKVTVIAYSDASCGDTYKIAEAEIANPAANPVNWRMHIPSSQGTVYFKTLIDAGSNPRMVWKEGTARAVPAAGKEDIALDTIRVYSISGYTDSLNNAVQPDRTMALQGDTVTLAVTAITNYVLQSESLSVKQGITSIPVTGSGPYTFTMPAGDVAVSAAFGLITYTVTYNKNGATHGTVPAAQTKTHGVNLTLGTSSDLRQEGSVYRFAGWNTQPNGSGTDYALSGTYTADSPVTLYAKWVSCTTVGGKGPAGGWVFYDKENYDGGWRYMECAVNPIDNVQWGAEYIAGTGIEPGYGKSNTELIIANFTGTAAHTARSYSLGGYSDWFLPSFVELYWISENLQKRGITSFTSGNYWTSSILNGGSIYAVTIDSGLIYYTPINSILPILPVRYF
ncbi:InlB B-repeat-containing protein [Breznakiella homolactica]|uniref:InlB B-repeat-containing protein n=1 Tax=Breznakiella homolactica TaxID=2798577 RepID=A0A7T8BAM0_9SPIR|nr:InlB B-repeat-containing protein [Breznakiella homolactica]QQO10834.1 InlB B-repeat-containing protein [Breznakiella homolactica]